MRALSILLLAALVTVVVSADECKEGDTKQEQCNICKCTQGIWSCTEKYCIGERDECKEGDTKQEQCNICKCTQGIWSCTKKHCIGKRATDCKPGESFKVDCNSCVCAPNGEYALCTQKACIGSS